MCLWFSFLKIMGQIRILNGEMHITLLLSRLGITFYIVKPKYPFLEKIDRYMYIYIYITLFNKKD